MSTTAGYLRLVVDSTSVEQSDRALDNFAKTSQRVEGSVKIDMGQIEKALANLGQKVVKLDSTMSGALKNTAQNTRDQAKTFDQLRASIDPAFAATQRYQQVQQELAGRVASGEVAQRTANVVLEQAASRYLGVATASERAAEAQRKAEQAVIQSRNSYEALRASVDPIYAASKRYEAALEALAGAQKAGIISDQERARTLQLLDGQLQGVTGAAGAAGGGVSKFGLIANQVGFQVQDVFVSGPMIGWFRAISQQAPQAAGAFSMLGGRVGTLVPLLGTVVAVSGALIPAFLGISKQAASLSDTISDLDATIREFRSATISGAGSVQYLRDEFGSFSLAAIELNERMQQLRIREVMLDAAEASDVLAKTFQGGLRSELARLEDFLGRDWFDENLEGAKRFRAALEGLRGAKGISEQLDAAKALREQLELSTGGLDGMNKGQREFYSKILETEAALSRASGLIASANGQTANWASLMSGVRFEIDAIQASIAAIGGGLISNAAKKVEIDALNAGMSIRDASRAAQEFRAEAGFDARAASATTFFERAAIEAERFVARQDRALEESLDTAREEVRERDRIAAKSGKASAAQEKSLRGLLQEISHRKTLLSLTGQERRQYETLIDVQRRLGKESGKYSAAQLEGYANQLIALEDQEDAMQRLENLAQERAGQITDILLDPGSAGEKTKELIKGIAAQALQQKIVLPIVGQFLGVQGVPSAIGGGGGTSGLLGGGGGGFNPLGLAGNLLGGGGAISGVASGLGGVLSGGGLGSSFANLGGLVTGQTAGFGAIGTALPALGLLAAIPVLISAFSRKYAGSGIRGDFDADGFDGSSIDFYKGGFFRSNRTDYKPLDREYESQLDATLRGTSDGLRDMADILGLSTDRLRDFNGEQFTIWTNGKTQEQIAEELGEEIQKVTDSMAELILGSDRFSKNGESASETLTRLSTSLAAVNDAADLLGQRGFAGTLRGGDRASDLVEQFGGLDAYTASVSAYYQAFYSETERQETAVRRLTEQFADLGLAMPSSRDGFRQMVDGIDLTTGAGRELYAQLLQMAGALDQVLPSVSQFTDQISGLVTGLDAQISEQINSARGLSSDARQAAQLWYRTATTLRGFIDGLLNTNLTSVAQGQTLDINRNRFQTAFELARGGDVDAARDIPGLARAYLENAREQASTSLEFRRVSAQVQNQVQMLAGIADLEGAGEDVLQALYNRQIDVLTQLGQLISAQGLTGDEVEGLADGIASLEGSLGGLDAAIAQVRALNYDELVGRLDVSVQVDASAPLWLRRLAGRAEAGLEARLDFIVREDGLSPAQRFIAFNELSNHVANVEFALTQDLDRGTRRMILREAATLRRDVALNIDPASSQNINSLMAIGNLLSGGGNLHLAGGVTLAPDEAFATLFSGVTSRAAQLVSPLNALRSPLEQLRDAINADRTQRENASKIQSLQNRGQRISERGRDRSARIIGDIEALEDRTGIQLLRNGDRDAILRQLDSGLIRYRADYTTGGAGLADFNRSFRGAGGLEAQIFTANDRVRSENDRLDALRAQIRALGEIPSFDGGGFTGYGARSGGLDGRGGFMAMLHRNEVVTDLTKAPRSHVPVRPERSNNSADVAREIRLLRQAVETNNARAEQGQSQQVSLSRDIRDAIEELSVEMAEKS